MAHTYNIDKTKPPDTGESPSLGASRIRTFKLALIERLENWVYGFLSDSETDEGLKKAPFKTQDPAPSHEDDKMIVYAKNVGTGGGKPELFVKDEDGNEIQITSGGVLNPAVIDHGGLAGLADDDHSPYYNAARHTKGVHDSLAIDHGSLGGRADDDHSIYLNNARHDSTTRHPIGVLKKSTGSYSEDIPKQDVGTAFATNKYGHQIEVKGESSSIKATYGDHAVTTGWAAFKYRMKNTHVSLAQYAYAQWSYHAASKQAAWGIWDTVAKQFVCVLVEEDEGYCKLFPELKAGQKLVKIKDIDKFLGKVKDKDEEKAKVKDQGFANYIREHAKVKEEDVEEIEA